MNHDDRKELLSALLDGELSESERADVLAHLEGCAACRAYFAELNVLRDALGELEEPEVPAGFASGVLARLHAEEAGDGWTAKAPKRRAPARRWASLAACAAIVLLAGSMWRFTHTRMGRADNAAGATESVYSIMNSAPAAPAAEPAENELFADEAPEESAPLEGGAAEEKMRAMDGGASAPVEPQAPMAAAGGSEARAANEASPVTEATSGPSPVLTIRGEGAAQWLAENGAWSEADGAYLVDNESLDLLPEDLTLLDPAGDGETGPDGVWHLVRAEEAEAAP